MFEPDGYRFVAEDSRLGDLDGAVWPTLSELRQHIRYAFQAKRFGRRTANFGGAASAS
jgi:hypothetical protein